MGNHQTKIECYGKVVKSYLAKLKCPIGGQGMKRTITMTEQELDRGNFYRYVDNSREALLDLKQRGYSEPSCLGSIDGNVDKLVVHRMKGRGCSWRLPGLRAMLALCRHREQLQYHAYHYFPVQTSVKSRHSYSDVSVKYPEVWQKPMPIFQGPDQAKPWVRSLYQEIHG